MISEMFFILTFGVGDAYTTLKGTSMGIPEANPFVSSVLKHYGPYGFLIFKFFGVALIILYLPEEVILLGAAIGLIITVWNIHQIKIFVQKEVINEQ